MIDFRIPGQMTEPELRGIEHLSRKAPVGGVIVEVGSLFGLSSYVWAKSAHRSCTIFCIDPWVREQWIIDLVETKIPGCPEFSRSAFEEYTSDCENLIPLQGYSPQDFNDWSLPVDIFFDDALHHNPYLKRNLRFWLEKMKPGGIFCGHDYCKEWPDVIKEVDEIAKEQKSKLTVVDSFWFLTVNDPRASQ